MKKFVSVILSVLLVLSLGAVCASAAENSADVYVTIANADGSFGTAAEKITVTDTDSDGVLTVNDALYCAHEKCFEGGATAGYATKETQYGLSLEKLWGNANGGSYGYYVNGASAWSLTDEVSTDDYLYAFAYSDLVAWSDRFSTFDSFTGDFDAGQSVELTLTYVADYDESFMPVFKPLEGANILIDGEDTGIKTDADGKAAVSFDRGGVLIVSAKSDDVNITPPVFVANVTGVDEPTEAPTEAVTETVTEAATEKLTATPDQTSAGSGTNTNAVQTGAPNAVIYLVLAMMILAFAIVAFKKQHEK